MVKRRVVYDFNGAANALVKEFLIKQGFVDEESGEVMEYTFIGDDKALIEISDMFFNIHDIYYDLKNNIEPDKFLEWYYYDLEWYERGYHNVNYKSYLMGCRHTKRTLVKEWLYKIGLWLDGAWFAIRYWKDNIQTKRILKEGIDKLLDEDKK